MAGGSLLGALGLALLTVAAHPAAYLATWVVLGVAIAATLYDPAFATLGRIFGARRAPADHRADIGRRLRLHGQLAGDAFFPVMDQLAGDLSDFRRLAGAGRGPAARLPAAAHARRARKSHSMPMSRCRPRRCRRAGLLSSWSRPHSRLTPSCRPGSPRISWPCSGAPGIDAVDRRPDRRAVRAVTGRGAALRDYFRQQCASAQHRALRARDDACGFRACWRCSDFRCRSRSLFAIMFGAANGLITITRGAVPLALFGAAGYGRLLGRIAKPFQIMQALAPVVLAFVVERCLGSRRIGAGGRIHRARAGLHGRDPAADARTNAEHSLVKQRVDVVLRRMAFVAVELRAVEHRFARSAARAVRRNW